MIKLATIHLTPMEVVLIEEALGNVHFAERDVADLRRKLKDAVFKAPRKAE